MRLSRLLLAALFVGIVGLLPASAEPPTVQIVRFEDFAAQPVPEPKTTGFKLPDGTSVRVVDPAQLKVKGAKKFTLPGAGAEPLKLPPAPTTFDYAKDKSGKPIPFPMHGNDRYGDCFYVAPIHMTESIRGVWGKPVTFNDRDIIARYLKVAGGDNGMYDDQILPEWKAGIIGPNGPHKIIDYATIDPADSKSVKSATYYLGGCVTTHSLRTTWMASVREGAVWTDDGRIDPNAGHAIHCCGVNAAGNMVMTTWGLKVQLTDAGLANSRAEVIVVVALDWFDARGFTPNGTHYNEIAEYWLAGTGRRLPVGLFPDPAPIPPVPPTPVPPAPVPPAPPGKGVTGAYTETWVDGRMTSRTFAANPLPAAVPGKPYVIDLKKYGPFVRMRLKHKLLAVIDDDNVIVTDNGDSITIAPKPVIGAGGAVGAPDWNAFLDFLEKLIPLILKIMALFGV